MDEFQILFGEDDALAREAGRVLEDLVRRGPAFGIHILLSTQSPAQIGTLGSRVYNQMALRIALRCRPQEAQAILGEGNDAATALEQPGEAIYNDEMGHKEQNTRIRVALLPVDERQRMLAALQTHYADRHDPPPVTFAGRAPAQLRESVALTVLARSDPPAGNGSADVRLGQPVEIKPETSARLERYPRSNLLIVGGDDTQAYGLLLAAAISLAAARPADGATFYVADFARPDTPGAELFARLRAGLRQRVEVGGPREVGGMLTELLAVVNGRLEGSAPAGPDYYFIVSGLHRWRELRPADAYGQTETGKQLLRLAEDGPEVGVHLIIWSDGQASLERAFKRGGAAAFDLRVVLRLPEKDSADLLGNHVAARLEDNRAYFRHEDWEMGRLEKFKPYTIPEDVELDDLLAQIRGKGGPDGNLG